VFFLFWKNGCLFLRRVEAGRSAEWGCGSLVSFQDYGMDGGASSSQGCSLAGGCHGGLGSPPSVGLPSFGWFLGPGNSELGGGPCPPWRPWLDVKHFISLSALHIPSQAWSPPDRCAIPGIEPLCASVSLFVKCGACSQRAGMIYWCKVL
jgi:hypothetical protein